MAGTQRVEAARRWLVPLFRKFLTDSLILIAPVRPIDPSPHTRYGRHSVVAIGPFGYPRFYKVPWRWRLDPGCSSGSDLK
jgi:hypothetical protein